MNFIDRFSRSYRNDVTCEISCENSDILIVDKEKGVITITSKIILDDEEDRRCLLKI